MAQKKTFEENLAEIRSSLKWLAGVLLFSAFCSVGLVIAMIVMSNNDEGMKVGPIVGFGINAAFALAYAIYITILARRATKYNGTGSVLGKHTDVHALGICIVGLLYGILGIAIAIVSICTGNYFAAAHFFFILLLVRLLSSAGTAASEIKDTSKSNDSLPLTSPTQDDEKNKINMLQQTAFMPTLPQQPVHFQFQPTPPTNSWPYASQPYAPIQTQSQPVMQQQWQPAQTVSQFQPQFQPQQQQSIHLSNPLFRQV